MYIFCKLNPHAQSETPSSRWTARTLLHPARFLFYFLPVMACQIFSQEDGCPISQFLGQIRHMLSSKQNPHCSVGWAHWVFPCIPSAPRYIKHFILRISSLIWACLTSIHPSVYDLSFCFPAREYHLLIYILFFCLTLESNAETASAV